MQHNENIVISDEGNEVEKAATVIQKHIRRDSIQRKYGIDNLNDDELTGYKTFVIGNDPLMSAKLKKYRVPDDKIVLLATSGMRSVLLACLLGNKQHIPKIILIDNSKEVHEFWGAVRTFMRDERKAATKELFHENFPLLLKEKKSSYIDMDSDAMRFIEALFKYGYDYVRAIIVHATLIKQSWADPHVFIKIKNILSYQRIDKIFMYPSNIASCMDDNETRNQLFENIQKLNPVVCIHTDLVLKPREGSDKPIYRPEKVYFLSNHNPTYVRNTLFQPKTANNSDDVNSSSPQNRLRHC
jgi:hypothetical protein